MYFPFKQKVISKQKGSRVYQKYEEKLFLQLQAQMRNYLKLIFIVIIFIKNKSTSSNKKY